MNFKTSLYSPYSLYTLTAQSKVRAQSKARTDTTTNTHTKVYVFVVVCSLLLIDLPDERTRARRWTYAVMLRFDAANEPARAVNAGHKPLSPVDALTDLSPTSVYVRN